MLQTVTLKLKGVTKGLIMTQQLTDLRAWINEEHHLAELERLRAGYDGCGCIDCQELYKTLDLSRYGSRVASYGDFILIAAGKTCADLWEKYHLEKPYQNGIETIPEEQKGVAKIVDKGILPLIDTQAEGNGFMQHSKKRGRPTKSGLVHRTTKWRREKQGVLL